MGIALVCGVILAASWIWYVLNAKNFDEYLLIFEKTRWTLRPFLPIFLMPEMMKAWKAKRWGKVALYGIVNLICASINLGIIVLAMILIILMVLSWIWPN